MLALFVESKVYMEFYFTSQSVVSFQKPIGLASIVRNAHSTPSSIRLCLWPVEPKFVVRIFNPVYGQDDIIIVSIIPNALLD